MKDQPMVIENEPDYSGDPINTTQKDEEEKEDEKKDPKQKGCQG